MQCNAYKQCNPYNQCIYAMQCNAMHISNVMECI